MRLKELLTQADLSETDKTELENLKKLAAEADYKFNAETGEEVKSKQEDEDESEDEPMGTEEVKSLVTNSITEVFKGMGLDESVISNLKASLEDTDKINPESIKSAIKEAVGGERVDSAKLAKSIAAALPKNALTEEKVKTLLNEFKDDFQKEQRSQSKMLQGLDAQFPVEHRAGNLTVAQKQLLNIALSGVTQHALDSSNGGRGIERPKGMNDGITDDQLKQAEANGNRYAKAVRNEVLYGSKAVLTDNVGGGAELINVALSSDIQARMYLESQIAAQMVSSEITMPTDPFKFPLKTTRATFYKGSEATAATASTPGTGDITLNAQKLIGMVEYSYEADEDSIIAVLPWLQENMAKGAAFSLEDALINGDDSGTHMDSDITDAADHRKLFKGLRHYAQAVAALKVSFATGGITAANLGALRKAIGRFGMKPSDLMFITGISGYNDAVLLEDTLTADLVGGAGSARIITGNAPQVFGVPIVASAAMREDLNAAGVYDGTTTTKGGVLLVHKPSWLVGVKRGFTVEVDVDKVRQVNQIIGSFRRAFTPKETPSATEQLVALGVNYDA